jgi:hypothetical protein
LLRHLLAFFFHLALAIAFTWPLAQHLSTAVPDFGDPLLNAWIVDWVCHALTHSPLTLFDAPIYHPASNMLAFSENMIGIAIVALPFHLAGLPSLAVYNIALLLGFAFSGYGAFVLARHVTGNDAAAAIAGVIHAFASFKIAHIQHLQIVWSGWLPLLLAALLVYWRRPDGKRAALLAGAFLMNGLTNIHWLLFGGFALLVTIALLQFAEPHRERAFWVRLAGALAIASLLLLPILAPYATVAKEHRARRTSFEARGLSALPQHWLVASSRNVLYGRFFAKWRVDEKELFPGVLAIALCVVALGVRRQSLRSDSGGASLRSVSESGGSAAALLKLDIAIAIFTVTAIAVALMGRITIGSLSFVGADVPAMIATVLLIVRLGRRLRVRDAEKWAGAVWIAVGFLGSLGWYFYLHPFLFRVVTPFRATRVPARWAVIAYVGIAVCAAIGASALIRRWKWMAPALLTLAVVETTSRVRWTHVPPVAPVYTWIAAERPRAILELPMLADGVPFLYLHAQTKHRVPLVNGTSGWETSAHAELRKMEPGPALVEKARAAGAELIVVHGGNGLPGFEAERRFGDDAVFRIRPAPADTASAPRAAPPR